MTNESVANGSAPTGSAPIFIVGSMRSGSTMLRLILDSHPRIAIGGETGFMGALLATKSIPNWKFGDGWYARLNWTETELDTRLREFYAGMFRRYASQQGKPRWGEKTPFHTAHMVEMARVFPDAVFVGIVRHPGAVALSLRKKFHYTFSDGVSYWMSTNLDLVRAAEELGPRFAACRYEDLVQHSEPVLRELLDFLDEPWSPAVLEHHRVQRAKGTPRAVEGSTITREPIDSERAVRWGQEVTETDLRALDGSAGLARYFGYNPVDPADRQQPNAQDASLRWLLTGDDIARRRRAWQHRVDFTQRPRTVVIDFRPEELADRLARAERALARTRSRKSVRMGDALRKVQHGRSLDDLREAWSLLRGPLRGGGH